VSDCYDDTELPCVDTCVAAVLCVGGPCSYVAEPCITNDFILQHATPLVAQHYDKTVALMFGHVMIWVAFSQYSTIMPAYLRNRIVGAYNLLPNQLQAGTNPTKQLDLVVSGRDNEVYLMEIDGNNQAPQQGQQPGGGNGAGGGNGGGGGVALAVGGRGANAGLLEAIVARLATIQRFLGEVEEWRTQDCAFSAHQYQGITAGMQCIHQQPNQVMLHAAHNQNTIQQQLAQPGAAAAPVAHGNINPNNASLSLTPHSLLDL
jgi:hypothetical protein